MVIETQLSDVDGGIQVLNASLYHLIKPGLEKNPGASAVVATHQPNDHIQPLLSRQGLGRVNDKYSCLNWTYADVQCAALKLVAGLQRQGVKPSSSIVTLIPNGIEAMVLYWTTILGKYTYIPLDPATTNGSRSSELQALLQTLAPDATFLPNATAAAAVDKELLTVSKKPTLKVVLDDAETMPATWTHFLAVASEDVDSETEERIKNEAMTDDLERIALILFTSGTTTGKPKGCPKTVKAHMACALAMDLRTGDVIYAYSYITQNFRAVASVISLIAWSKGHSLVMPGLGFSPSDLLDAIPRFQINLLVLLPFTLHTLVADAKFRDTTVTGVKKILMGADMITKDLFLKAVEAFPNADVSSAHGMTEGGGALVWPVKGVTRINDIPWHNNIAPIGKVQRGARLKIASENNRAVSRNTTGELHVSSNAFLRRYQDDVKPEDFYVDGDVCWFKTGDIGMINDDGWVYILGRLKDIIKRAGVSISPSALESALNSHLRSQTSVIAVSHQTLGQEPFAVVRSLNNHSKEQAMQHIVEVFGEDYALQGIATLEDLGLLQFPVNQSEKIMKLELQKVVAGYLSPGNPF